MNFFEHIRRQAAFSRATFGPGSRTKGVSDHIKKELKEVAKATSDAERSKEWVDVAILGLDGLWRSCAEQLRNIGAGEPTHTEIAGMVCRLIREKQDENEVRDWPDWRTADPEKAIEHIRTKEQSQ
jgi:hypothetical protein